MASEIKIIHGDCEKLIKSIPDKSIDLILQDPPYGATNLKWDIIPDLDLMWPEWLRIIKDNGAILFTGQQPFVTDLINSCRKYFRYEIIWQKTQKTNFANAKKMPLRGHENILVFYKRLPTYNPQKYYSQTGIRKRVKNNKKNGLEYEGYSGGFKNNYKYENEDGMMYPDSVIKFSNWNGAIFGNTDNAVDHPTQKPVDLIRYLIKTYSNKGDVVFDGYSGSGTTAIACLMEERNFIGYEKEEEYYNKSIERLETHKKQLTIF